MADTFLSPGGDYTATAEFCGSAALANREDFMEAVDSAASAVRKKCGPIVTETFTTRHPESRRLVMPFRVTAVLAATGSGLTAADLTAGQFSLDPTIGTQLVERVDGQPVPACTLEWTSGWDLERVPADLMRAGRELARHRWRVVMGNQRNAALPPQPDTGADFDWPRSAWFAVREWMLTPLGFA